MYVYFNITNMKLTKNVLVTLTFMAMIYDPVFGQTLDKLKLTDTEVPAKYKRSDKMLYQSIQAVNFYKQTHTYENLIGKVTNKEFQSFESKDDKGAIYYYEFEKDFNQEGFLEGILWGGQEPGKEHPEEYFLKDNILVIWSFGQNSELKKISKDKIKKYFMENIEKRLAELGITIPDIQVPFANYVPAKRSGNLIFTAGQASASAERVIKGKVGREIDIQTGKEATRICVINCLAAIKQLSGSLANVKEIIAVHGLINSVPEFTGQAEVMNGASDLMVQIFGEKGRHVRTSVGVASLPFDFSASVYIVVEVEDQVK